ncbi:MAG: hypothetical protein KIT14_19985 [bacterium]|nr:hypothetical protein [bacterium]
MAARPWAWPAVARLARQQRVAERQLRRLCAVLAGGGLEAFLPPAVAGRHRSGE